MAIKERSLLSANTQHTATIASCLQSFALPHSLPHPVLRRAPRAGTVGLRNPVSCDPVRERGDKVFGERSARLLASSSSRTLTRTMSSPTRTSFPTSTTSLATCLSLTITPTAVLHPHRLQHRMSPDLRLCASISQTSNQFRYARYALFILFSCKHGLFDFHVFCRIFFTLFMD
jgi:hypothetical protein